MMLKKKLLLILLISNLGYAQIQFTENIVIDNSLFIDSPFDVAIADLDGDNDMDFLVSSYFDDKFIWLENQDGEGTEFTQHIISDAINTPWGVETADIDGDGDYDILVASLSDDYVVWYENLDGNGNFIQKQLIIATDATFVNANDIDGDGDLDIVWASRNNGDIKWSRNTDGLGTFSNSFSIQESNISIPGIVVVDIDGDNDVDVLTARIFQNGNNSVSWYRNDTGTGIFSNNLTIESTPSIISDVYAGDIDNDGDIDVVAKKIDDDKLVWYENIDGQGNFSSEIIISNTLNGSSKLSLKDFDNDGSLDIVASSNDNLEIVWFQNNGLGNFSDKINIESIGGDIRSLKTADVNADGNFDIITVTANNNIKWYNNINGLGSFSPYTITKTIDGGKVVYAEDLDGDGDLDLLSTSHWDDKVAWYEKKNGYGDFSDSQIIISDNINGAGGLFAADIDGDGDKDVLASSSLDSYFVWFENTNGQGDFGNAITIDDELNGAGNIYASDIDDDGDMDIFCTTGTKIIWYENLDGLGSFSLKNEIDSISNFFFGPIDFGDLDGDNDIDISVASNYGLLHYLNLDGQGNFSQRQIIEDFSYDSFSTKISDIDNDGDNDLIYLGNNSTSNFIGWSENTDGLGTFGNIQLITTVLSNPRDIAVFDIDNDGDKDIVSTSYQSTGVGMVAWYENTDGQGNFNNTQQIISTKTGYSFGYDLYQADINQDNNTDIITINNLADEIIWYGNLGLNPANRISGTVKFDAGGNSCDPTDELLTGVLVISEGTSSSTSSFTQENGEFNIFIPEDGIINTQVTYQLPNYYQLNPVSFQSSFVDYGNVDTFNFCIEPSGAVDDLSITIVPNINDPRPGFDTSYQLVLKNNGTTVLSGDITFQFDELKIQFLNASETVASQTANTLTFDYVNLNPFETRTIDLDFNVFPPPTTNIDDELVSTASINPSASDETQEDNTFTLEQTVIGSYDPNDIQILEGDQVHIDDADEYIHFLIRFQNTGTASAINVRVEHILDSKLDWTTMQLQSLSHDGRVEITDGSDVQFIFNNINLPDQNSDEEGSIGYIAFKIKPLDNIVIGDIISGVADIYFDFNPPIITNTATTQFLDNLDIDNFSQNEISIYPNPTDGLLHVKTNSTIEKIEVFDMLGRKLFGEHFDKPDVKIDLSELQNGVYFVKIQSDNIMEAKKFIKN